jgi:hypothetical protein
MHFNFHFTAIQILWTLTFAALLVLLIVLLGRERIRRFPWFTSSIVLLALRLLMSRLLFGKLSQMALTEIFVTLADILAVVALLVVVEMARRAFVGLGRTQWIANTAGAVIVAGFVLWIWGPWPAWKTITFDSPIAIMRFMQLVAQKLDFFVSLLTIELGVVVVMFGRRFKAGWRSHTQQILIGLSTISIAQLIQTGILQLIARGAAPQTEAEYLRLLGLRDKLVNGTGAIFVAVLLWWIVCLWIDEPGTKSPAELPAEEAQSEA